MELNNLQGSEKKVLWNVSIIHEKRLNLLGERVKGVTGEVFNGPYARYNEIIEYVEKNNIKT